MKTYEQMAEAVFAARAEHFRRQLRRKRIAVRCVPAAASFCFAVVLGTQFWEDRQELPKLPALPETSVPETETIPETVSEPVMTETVPETIPELIMTESIPETVPEPVMTELIPETVPEPVMTELIPEIVPEPVITETIPETVPEPVETELIPEAVPEPVMTETIPETVPEPVMTETIPETVPEPVMTETIPETIPEPTETETVPETENSAPVLSRVILKLYAAGSASPEMPEIPVSPVSEYEEVPFLLTGYQLPEKAVGEWFDTVNLTIRYPDGTSQQVLDMGDAYLVQNTPYGSLAAVRFKEENVYYLFRNSMLSEEEYQMLLEDSGILQ